MELYKKLSRLQWLLQRYHLRNHSEHGPIGDPTRGQGRVLAVLKMKPEISTKELSYLLDIRQQSLNELLNKLEKQDFVTRTQSETDKRVLMVNLTEKGKNVQSQDVGYSDIFNCLNEEEKEAFSEYLTRVISALEIELNYEPNTEYEFEPDDHGSKEHPLPHGPHPHGPHPPKPPKPHPHDPYINFYEPEDE